MMMSPLFVFVFVFVDGVFVRVGVGSFVGIQFSFVLEGAGR